MGAGRLLLSGVGRGDVLSLVVSPFVLEKDSCFTILVLGAAGAIFLLEGVRKKLATCGGACCGLSAVLGSSMKSLQAESRCELMFASFTGLLHIGQWTMIAEAELEAFYVLKLEARKCVL